MPSRVKPARSATRSDAVLPTFTYAATRLMPSERACSAEERAIVVSNAAAARVREHEVPNLDNPALGIEVVERASADDLARLSIDGGERQQPSRLGERRQVSQ